MKSSNQKEEFEVVYEYAPAPDAEERLLQIFEFLLQDEEPIDKGNSMRYNKSNSHPILI